MFNFFTFIKFLFWMELFIAGMMFAPFLCKRRRFVLRCVLGFFGCSAFAIFFPAINTPLYTIFVYIAIFAVFVAYLALCFSEPFRNLLFVGVSAYTAEKILSMSNSLISLTDVELFFHTNRWNTWWFLMYLGCFVVVYFLFWLLFVRRVRKHGSAIHIKNYWLLLITLIACVINTCMGWLSTSYITGNTVAQLFDYLWNLLACILLLLLEIHVLGSNNAEYQITVMQELIRQKEAQYRFSKENIDAINRKCHDLKYILRASAAEGSSLQIKDIISAVDIYDSSLKTGNETLDLILSEKSLYCKQHGIIFTCMANGALLNFIAGVDLYVMCGNLLDNAVRSVKDFADAGRRNIYINVKRSGSFVLFSMENDFEGKIKIVDGLPVTTKRDAQNHGFGLQSVRLIAEKYGGSLSVTAENGVFGVNILFPAHDDAA